MGARITGTGSWLPARTVSNDEIAATLDTSDEWIFSHTGIKTRHIAGPDESTASMSAEAGRAALDVYRADWRSYRAGIDQLVEGEAL